MVAIGHGSCLFWQVLNHFENAVVCRSHLLYFGDICLVVFWRHLSYLVQNTYKRFLPFLHYMMANYVVASVTRTTCATKQGTGICPR